MNRQLRDYLPPIWLQARQMAVLAETEQPEVEQLWDGLQDGLDNQFLSTAGEYGISRWEAFLKIQPRGSETLDERRFRLQARLNERLPYTFLRLCEMLETLCGKQGYEARVDPAQYLLTVRIALTSQKSFEEVAKLLDRVVPANLIVDLSLKYNSHAAVSRFRHSELGAFTHNELRSAVLQDSES